MADSVLTSSSDRAEFLLNGVRVQWATEFTEEIREPGGDIEASVERSIALGTIFIWTDGEPVACARGVSST
ncbi:MAG: hypothetical protein WCL39_15355, partial [Armatimonadota bacterium]